LPGLDRVAERCTDASLGDPFEDATADEHRALIRAREQGRACWLTGREKISMTRCKRMAPATSMARHSRVYSSTTVRHLIWPPSAVVNCRRPAACASAPNVPSQWPN
jgi:hypothetical protein